MTKDEFEKGYAKRSGVTVKWLHDHNQLGVPCDCGEDGCAGWQMKHITVKVIHIECGTQLGWFLRDMPRNPDLMLSQDFMRMDGTQPVVCSYCKEYCPVCKKYTGALKRLFKDDKEGRA